MIMWLAVARRFCILVAATLLLSPLGARGQLPSWNDSASKRAILNFVACVTDCDNPDFVPPSARIAVFDNDGTLWSEQPMYVQMAFVLDRIKILAEQNPGWREVQPFKAALEGDSKALAESGEHGLLELVMATHAGMTTDEFAAVVRDWLATARHPIYQRPYTKCVYQPMVELLAYLRKNDFKTFIVSGGGVEFMRPWVEDVYGIPPEQVVGSSIKVRYEIRDGQPALIRLGEIDLINDKEGKPVGIHKFIGQRPLMAFGNSDGDYEMLQYVTSGAGPRLGVIVHHTDAERESAYDRQSHFGRLDKALNDASKNGWTIVDMKSDWQSIFLRRVDR
ncbi:HAD family hydrolase [Pirellulaceae bacterium SH449]